MNASTSSESAKKEKRIVEEGRYFFGVGSQNQTNGRIYVYVEGDDSHVHEYRHSKHTSYYCLPCFVLDKTQPKKTALWNGILRVPDGHICEPLPLAQVQEDQDKIKQKFATTGTVRRSRKRPVASTSSTTSTSTPFKPRVLVPVRKVLPTPTSSDTLHRRQRTPFALTFLRARTSNPSSTTTPQGNGRTTRSQKKNVDAPPESKRAKSSEITEEANVSKESDEEIAQQQSPVQSLVSQNPFLLNVNKSETLEPSNNSSTSTQSILLTSVNQLPNAQLPINDQFLLAPSSSIPAPTPSSTTPSSLPTIPSAPFPTSDSVTPIRFYKPSSFFLTECCEKVGIEYQDEAYDFWNQIKINKILPASTPKTVHSTSEPVYYGYDCLSILLTGAETQAQQIREEINRYIYQQNSESGLQINRGTEGRALFSPSLTEYHLPWISKLFKCRIGIFSSNQWKRYGNWALDDGTPIFLLEYKNFKYSPIMTFN